MKNDILHTHYTTAGPGVSKCILLRCTHFRGLFGTQSTSRTGVAAAVYFIEGMWNFLFYGEEKSHKSQGNNNNLACGGREGI